MFEIKFDLEEKYNILLDVCASICLAVYAFIVNIGIRISGLYMDDLYMWSTYGEQSFLEYVFPFGSTRFRPVYWFIAWIELGVIRSNITWIVTFNIIFAAAIAIGLYLFAKKLSGSRFASFILAVLFLSSRFSYYNISQLLGLMEALCIAFLIAILYLLHLYVNEKGNTHNLYVAVVLYILLTLTHERFMVLLPLFIYVIVIKKDKWHNYIYPVLAFLCIQVLRLIFIGTISPAGTGSTNVADTFTIKGALKNAIAHVLYMLGINAGPEHLNGVSWQDTHDIVKLSVIISIIMLSSIFISYIYKLVKNRKKKNSFRASWQNSLLYLLTIVLCIASSSVTIRVELRWVYGPFVAALLLLAHIYGQMKELKTSATGGLFYIDGHNYVPVSLLLLWFISAISMDIYARGKYEHTYIYEYQKRYNSLADISYGKYGEDIFDKEIYVIGNHYEMSDFTARTFFKVYAKDRTSEKNTIKFIDSYRDINQIKPNVLVFKEEIENNSFSDVTDMLSTVKCERIKGYYKDGWMDEKAEIYAMADKDGVVKLEFMYPADLQEGQKLKLKIDDKEEVEIEFKENISYYEINKEPYSVINLKFDYNFYLPDAQEQRGEDRFSIIVNIL